MSETTHMLCHKNHKENRELYTTVVLFTEIRKADHPLDGKCVHIQIYKWVGDGLFWARSEYATLESYEARSGTYAIDDARLVWNKLKKAGYVFPPHWMSASSLMRSAT